MAKSLDFVETSVWVDASKFSDKAKAQGWVSMTTNLIKALAKVLDVANRLNNYERADATCTTYDGLYGADELCFNLAAENRRKQIAGSTYDYYTNSGGFYLTAYQIATKMWGFDTTELPEGKFVSTPRSAGAFHPAYSETITLLEAQGVSVSDYWKVERYIPEDSSSGTFKVYDTSTFFNGVTVWYGMNSATQRMGTIHQLLAALYHYRSHFLILRKMMELTPTSRGGRTFPASYSTRDCLYSFPSVQPHNIVRIRQALTEVRAAYATNGYNPYNPGTSTTSISSGRIRNRIKKALANRGITFASAEIPDKTKDISEYYTRQTTIDDPLIIAGTGFAMVEMADSHNSTGNGWWGAFVPAVHLCRKYLMRSYMIAYDYKETTNPNALEAANGKVSYTKSNRYVYLNSRSTSTQNWKIKTHEYDEYWTGGEKPYLNSISTILRTNIAKTALGMNPGENLARDIDKAWPPLYFREQWCFLPTLTMFGVENKKTSRAWTNVQIALDPSTYYEVNGSSGEWVGSAGLVEGDLNGDSMAFEDTDSCVDLIENGWELGDRRYQFKVNPQCSDAAETARDYLYIPTQTPAVYRADTQDATIPNRIACFYLPKADGTATSNQMGYSAPYSTNPFTVAFALIPFHTTETDGLYKAYTGDPAMSYSATAYENL